MLAGGSRLRALALIGAGAFAVHQLRYLLGYGDRAADALAEQGHGYLWAAELVLALALAAALGQLVLALARPRRPLAGDRAPSFPVQWLSASGVLALVHVVQESLEGVVFAGHHPPLAGVLGHGGWTALVAAAAVGALVALLLRGAGAAVVRRARALRLPHVRRRAGARPRPATPDRPGLEPLARHLAGRAPPTLAS